MKFGMSLGMVQTHLTLFYVYQANIVKQDCLSLNLALLTNILTEKY